MFKRINVMDQKKDFIISLITLAIIVGLIALLCVMLIPILADIFGGQDGRNAIEIINAHGARGVPILACLQALQVITTVVPSMLIQIPAGLVYGTWAGLMICLAGSIIGNMIVFSALRQFSTTIDHIFPTRRKKREEKARRPKKKSRLPFFLNPESLNRMPHPELVAFYVYLIPGIPNGVLPHIFARTKVSFARYLIAVVAGNAPATLVCTLVGDRLAHGDWRGAVVIILIFAACIGIALLMRRKLIALISGGYSLNLGFSNRRRAEVADDSAETASNHEGRMAGNEAGAMVGNEAGERYGNEVDAMAGNEAGAGPGDGSDAKVNGVIAGEGNPYSGEAEKTSETAATGRDGAEPDDEDAPDEMQALGTTDIVPHGWRILKGKKP
jgi:uncharacterized membrane protein YdjX (TVP38/TMEM64 family)